MGAFYISKSFQERTHQGPASSTFPLYSDTSLFSGQTYQLHDLRAPCKEWGAGELKRRVLHTAGAQSMLQGI